MKSYSDILLDMVRDVLYHWDRDIELKKTGHALEHDWGLLEPQKLV